MLLRTSAWLLAIVSFANVPELPRKSPPPLPCALFPVIVLLVIERIEPKSSIPPPKPPVELFSIVLRRIVSLPSLSIPPPEKSAALPLTIESCSVRVPLASTQIPPPTPGLWFPLPAVSLPPSIVTPPMVAVAAWISKTRLAAAKPAMTVERAPAPSRSTALVIWSSPAVRS